jgi:hypothetical protein
MGRRKKYKLKQEEGMLTASKVVLQFRTEKKAIDDEWVNSQVEAHFGWVDSVVWGKTKAGANQLRVRYVFRDDSGLSVTKTTDAKGHVGFSFKVI